jgi:hypothetical protein
MSTMKLHLCGLTTDGKLWHTSRSRNDIDSGASWGRWEEVKPKGATDIGRFVSAACGVRYVEDMEEIHICGVTQDGKLWYTNRTLPQDWQPFEDLRTQIQGNWDTFHVQDVTFDDSFLDVCVIVLTNSGERHILHTRRHFDGTWDSFQDVNDPQVADFPGSFISVGCANVSPQPQLEELHVCGITDDGKLWHTLRSSLLGSFSWLPFANVQTPSANGPDHFTKVCITQGIPDLEGREDLHVFTQAAGDLWHTVRFSNPPRWQPTFDSIKKQAGDPGSFGSISCANVDGQLHICAATADGKLWHTLLTTSDPAVWQSFEDVTEAAGPTPGVFCFVSLAVVFTPGRIADNPICDAINQNIANAWLQIQMMQQINPNNPAISGRQQAIATLESLRHEHLCP